MDRDFNRLLLFSGREFQYAADRFEVARRLGRTVARGVVDADRRVRRFGERDYDFALASPVSGLGSVTSPTDNAGGVLSDSVVSSTFVGL